MNKIDKTIFIIYAILSLFALSYDISLFANRMSFVNQRLKEIETKKITDPSSIFNKYNLNKSAFLDYINVFDNYDYLISYQTNDDESIISGYFSYKKPEIINRINSNDNSILYSVYVDSYSIDDELCVNWIIIRENSVNISEADIKRPKYHKNFTEFLEASRKQLFIEKRDALPEFLKNMFTEIVGYSVPLFFFFHYAVKKEQGIFLRGNLLFFAVGVFALILRYVAIICDFLPFILKSFQ